MRLLVAGAEAAERARLELTSYERENAPRQRPSLPARPLSAGFDAALAYCAVLLFFFVASRRHAFGVDWLEIGAAAAGRILQGEWWRTVTALGLHADLDHLLGNLFFGTLFGLLVAQLLGWGLGWLAIIVAGTLGNFIDALLHPAGHSAIGASTALFGALGILAAHAWQARVLTWRGGVRRWAPLAGGTMLLVLLGTSGERTDVTAHVAGFAAGWLIGLALAGPVRMPQGPRCTAALRRARVRARDTGLAPGPARAHVARPPGQVLALPAASRRPSPAPAPTRPEASPCATRSTRSPLSSSGTP